MTDKNVAPTPPRTRFWQRLAAYFAADHRPGRDRESTIYGIGMYFHDYTAPEPNKE